jgi:putative ABC transport system permease protein
VKTSIYFNYTTRSLLRGGQRTVLAFFCVGVGVMAIVALQLVGLMITNALITNVRDANGGDINVSANVGAKPFTQEDLKYFAQLKSNDKITNYTAVGNLQGGASFSNTFTISKSFTLLLVDPKTFPLVAPPVFNNPSSGSIASLLTGNGVIIDQKIADTYHKHIGDQVTVHLAPSGQQQLAELVTVKIVGIVTDSGVLAQNSSVMLMSQADYQRATSAKPVLNTIDITTANQTQTDAAAKDITNQFPLTTVQTAADALKSTQDSTDIIKKFLEIAGLLALLIGGVGIVNTMQVLLSRRKIEIAMLKTTGYRRTDLYLLFGLEAGLLGLIGGVLGSIAAIGISYLVRNVVQQVFSLDIPFLLDWSVVGGGVLIGLATALIFGLLPIVQSANIRPLNVIRDLPENRRAGSVLLTIFLLLILSVLFCILSSVILNDAVLGVEAVYGTFAFLLLLSGFFTLVALVVSKLPVPERFSWKFLTLILVCAIVSLLIARRLPAFGYLLLALTGLGFLTVLMPRTWKVNSRMALRNIGRQRARTTTTLLALFVGIFTIGLILALGQDVRDLLNNTISNVLPYNVLTATNGSDSDALQAQINSVPGLQKYTRDYEATFAPLTVNGVPLEQLLQGVSKYPGNGTLGRYGTLGILSGMRGYDVANGNLPDIQNSINIVGGRNLNASDEGTNHILIPRALTVMEPLKGKIGLGSTITVVSLDGKSIVTFTVVGIYKSIGINFESSGLYGTKGTVTALSPGHHVTSVFYLKVDPAKVDQALAKVGQIAPKAESFSLADLGDFVSQFLNDIILVLIVIASLSLLAGVIIIANAVALAMLERRRELGILKSVGYTSSTVLGEVLIENAAIGGLGALLAMLLVTLVTSILGNLVFKSNFAVSGFIVIGLIGGSALLAVLTALLVAWGSVRVRPLEVLRYE